MAIKISGSTIIDDSRVIVNADKIGIGTPSPTRELSILSPSPNPTGIGVSAANLQGTSTNKAISVFNAGITSTFSVSYTGIVTANEYFGTFKGTIDTSAAIDNANKIKINHNSTNDFFNVPFFSSGLSNGAYGDIRYDNASSLQYNPSLGNLRINSGAGNTALIIRTTSNELDRAIAFQNSGFAYVGALGFIDRSGNQADLAFFTGNANNNLGTLSETMRLTKERTVGIGTTRPDGLLHVFGGNAIVTGGSVGIGTTIPGTNIHISGTGQNGIRIDTNATGLSFHDHSEFIGFMGNDSGKLFINAGGAQDTLSLRTNGASRIQITNGGVGINSTAPNTRLDVIKSFANRTWTPGTSVVSMFERGGHNRITIVSGSNSVGEIDFGDTNDDNAGYIRYHHLEDSMSFRVDRGERLRITSAGDVGIGTTIPTGVNAVAGNTATLAVGIVTASEYFGTFKGTIDPETAADRIEKGNTKAQVVDNGSDGHFLVETEGTERLRILSDGNVGIGSDSTGGARLRVYKDNATSGDNRSVLLQQWRGSLGSTGERALNLFSPSTDSLTDYYRFQTGNAYKFQVDSVDALCINSDGNVGIGTDSVNAELHVRGNGNVTSFVEAIEGDALLKLSNTGNGNYSGIDFLRERQSGTGVSGGSIFMKSDTSAASKAYLYIQAQSASAGAGVTGELSANNGVRLKLHGVDGIFSVETGPHERFRIDNDGNVGIGTTIPADILHIHDASPGIRLSDSNNLGDNNPNPSPYAFAYFDANAANAIIHADKGNDVLDSRVAFAVDNSEKVRISSGGSLFVGVTTTSNNEKFVVDGNAKIEGALTLHKNNPTISLSDSDDNPDYQIGNINGALRFQDTTNNATRLIIDTTGNIGVNSANPAAKLDIFKVYNGLGVGNAAARIYGTDSNVAETGIRFVEKGTNLHTQPNAYLMRGISDGETKFVFGANGNVGIGSTIPAVKLDVNGDIRVTSKIELGQFPNASFLDFDDDNSAVPFPGGTNNVTLASISGMNLIYDTNNNDNNGFMIAHGNPNAELSTAVLVIDENDRVGIGTENPKSLLEVAGSAAVLTITDTRNQSFPDPSVGDILSSLAFDTDDLSGGAGSASHPRAKINLVTENTFGSKTGLSFATKSDTGSAPEERMRITHEGHVGIGTTNPTHENALTNNSKVLAVGILTASQIYGIVEGTLRPTGNLNVDGVVTAVSFESTVAAGTAPFVVASDTKVENLNADLLDGKSTANSKVGNTVVVRNAAGGFIAGDVTFDNITGAAATFSGNVSIAGTLTYEDVTNVDSLGIITARDKIELTAAEGQIEATGATGLTLNASDSSAYARIRVAGDTRLHIKSDGKVGIGSAIPQDMVTIRSGANETSLRLVDPSNNKYGAHFSFYNNENEVRIGGIEDTTKRATIRIDRDANDNAICIDNEGKVGIGSVIPQAKLDIYRDDNSEAGSIQITQDGTGDAAIDFQLIGTREYSLGIDNSDGDKFKLSGSAGLANNTLLTVTNSGDVGIGTDDPQEKLHVHGDGNVSAGISAIAGDALLNLSNSGDGNYSGINFQRERGSDPKLNNTGGSIWMPSDTSSNQALLYIQTQSASAGAGVDSALSDNNGVRLKLASQPNGITPDSAFTIEMGSSEAFRIDANGNIGIGTTIPTGLNAVAGNTAKLAVGIVTANEYFGTFKGTIDSGVAIENANKIQVNTNSTDSDFTIPFVDSTASNDSYQALLIDGNVGTSLRFNASDGRLQINGTGRDLLTIRTTNNNADRAIAFQNSGNSYVGALGFVNRGEHQADLAFFTGSLNATLSNVTETMRLTKESTVGIGTTRPDGLLHVFDGNAIVTGGSVGIGTTIPGTDLHISGTGTNGIRIDTNATGLSFHDHSEFIGFMGNDSGKLFINAGGAQDTLSLRTNGASRIQITNGGVGIGTVIPASKFHIHSSQPRLTMSDSDTGAHHRINADSGAGNLAFDVDYSSTTSTPSFIVNIKGDEKFRVTSGGDVGIGTFNPTATNALTNNNTTLAVGIVTANEVYGTFKGSIDSGVAIENANNVNITNDEDIGNTAHYIHFGDATSGYDGVKVDSTGLVYKDSQFGLGTNSPGASLHISTTLPRIRLTDTNDSNIDHFISGSGSALHFQADENQEDGATATTIRFSIDADEKMRINASDQVGIGTNDPKSELHVENAIGTATTVIISQQKTYGVGTGTAERARLDLAIREVSHAANNRVFGRMEAGTNSETSSQNGFLAFSVRQSGSVSEKLRITSTGKLEIDRGSASNAAIDIKTTATTDASRIRFVESGTSEGELAYSHNNNQLELVARSGNQIVMFTNGTTEKLRINLDGDLLRGGTGQDIGSSSAPWDKVYANEFIGEINTTQTNLETGDLIVTGIATFQGNVSIAGTLTYEDVTNVDAIGLITARNGIHVTGAGVSVTGISTFLDKVGIGNTVPNATLEVNGPIKTNAGFYKAPHPVTGDGRSDVALVMPSESAIYVEHIGPLGIASYTRRLIGEFDDGVIEIGQNQTGIIKEIRVKPGDTGFFSVYKGSTDSEIFRVENDGNVRAKTGTQFKGFHLVKADGGTVAQLVGHGSDNDEGGLNLWDGGVKKVQILANGVSYLNGGNVGIGSAIPTAKLDLIGNTKFQGDVSLTRGTATHTLTRTLSIGGARNQGNHFAAIELKNYDSDSAPDVDYVAAKITGTVPSNPNNGGELVFYTTPTGGDPTGITVQERLRITAGGNVGIGTDNPLGTNAVANNNKTLAVGILTANQIFGPVTGPISTNENVNIGGNLDVDGTTTLDGLTVSEAAVFQNNLTTNGMLTISNNAPILKFNDVNDSKEFFIVGDSNTLSIRMDNTGGGDIIQKWNSNGTHSFYNTVTFNNNIDANGDLDVDGLTNLDHINIAGITTIDAGAFAGGNISTGGRSIQSAVDIRSDSLRGGIVVRNKNNFRDETFNAGFQVLDPYDSSDTSFAFRAAEGTTLVDNFWVKTSGDGYFSGNVGIGTSVPNQKLHIEHDSFHQILLKRVGTFPSEAIFSNAGAYTNISNNATGIRFLTGGSPIPAMVIRNDRNVGIGTDNAILTNALTDNNATLAVGIVTANEVYGTFKGTIDSGVAIENANKIKTTKDESSGNHFLTFVDSNNTSGTSYEELHTDGQILYNPEDNELTVNNGRVFSNQLIAGQGSGSVAMTVNDGYGNANIAFNHRGGTPDKKGSSGRIEVGVDTAPAYPNGELATMVFELYTEVTAGTPTGGAGTNKVLEFAKHSTPTDSNTFIKFHEDIIPSAHNTFDFGRSGNRIATGYFKSIGANVGIGTNDPDQTLHVYKGSAGTVTSDGNAVITLENNTHSVLQILSPADVSGRIMFGDPDDNNVGQIKYDHDNDHLSFNVNGGERLGITSTGILELERGSAKDEAIDIKTTATTGASRIRFVESGTSEGELAYSHNNDQLELVARSGNQIVMFTNGTTEKLRINLDGDLLRGGTGQDIGASSAPWDKIYANEFVGLINTTQENVTTGNLLVTGIATFQGNVSIAGTLTYEDVTNVDAIGLVTARNGIHVTGGNVGIGTDNPLTLLSLYSDAPNEELLHFDMGSPDPTLRRGWKFKQKDDGTSTKLNLQADQNGKSFLVSDSSDNVTFQVNTSSSGSVAHNGAFIYMYPLVAIGQTLAHIGDTDTKLEFPADNTIKFDTAGDERLRITSDGNVGINSTIPAASLEVLGQSTSTYGNGVARFKYVDTDDTGGGSPDLHFDAKFIPTGTYFKTFVTGGGTDFLIVDADNTAGRASFAVEGNAGSNKSFTVDSTGAVRINTTRSGTELGDTKLHVVGGTASGTSYDTAVFAGGQNSTAGSGARIYLTGCENDPLIRGVMLQSLMTDNGNTHDFIIRVGGPISSTEGERLRITTAGNVGIGTDNPIGANALANNNTTLAVGIVTANEYYGTFKGTIDTDAAITNANNINITNDQSDSGTHYIHFGSATSGYDGVEVDSTGLVYKDGLFGVGTNNPNTQLTVVNPNALGNTVGFSTQKILKLQGAVGNAGILEFKNKRIANGSDWFSSTFRIQRVIDVTEMGYIDFGTGGGASGSDIQFGKTIDSSTDRVYMHLDNTGNVGIGTDNPEKKLDVFGSFRVKDESGKDNLQIDGGNGVFKVFQSKSAWTSVTYSPSPILAWDFKKGPGDLMYMASGGNTPIVNQMALVVSDNHGFKVGRAGYDGADFDVSETAEYLRVTIDGNVGIGTSIPTGVNAVAGNTATLAVGILTANQIFGPVTGPISTNENVDIGGNLDVDGTTTLDGLTVDGTISSGDIIISDANPTLTFTDTSGTPNDPDFRIIGNAGKLAIQDIQDSHAERFVISSGGLINIQTDLDVGRHLKVSGVSTFVGNAQFNGNVSIGGTLTYEDVTNIESIGIITAKNDIHVIGIGTQMGVGTDNPQKKLHVLTASGDTSTAIPLLLERANSNNNTVIQYKNTAASMYAGLAGSGAKGWGVGTASNVGGASGNKFMIERSTGNVGIGTNNPDAILHIHSSGPGIRLSDSGNTGDPDPYAFAYFDANAANAIIHADKGNDVNNSRVAFAVDNDEKMRIDHNGKVGIGTDLASEPPADRILTICSEEDSHNYLSIQSGSAKFSGIVFGHQTGNTTDNYRSYIRHSNVDDSLNFHTNSNSTAKLSITSGGDAIVTSGKVLIGTTSSRATRTGTSNYQGSLQIESDSEAAFTMTRFGGVHPSRLNLQHARGTIASIDAVQDDDQLGQISFSGWDGDTFTNAAEIRAEVDGAPGDDDMPGRLIFKTTPDGSTAAAERLRIGSNGKINCSYENPGDARYGILEITKSGTSNVDPNWSYLSFHRGDQIAWQQGINANDFVIASTSGANRDTLENEKFRITSTGALAIGGATNYGTTGKVLTSNGNAAPSWEDAGGSDKFTVESTTGTYTLVAADSGKLKTVTGNVTIPDNVFEQGDTMTVYNNSGSTINLTQGSGATVRLAGSSITGTRQLAQRGLATIICVVDGGGSNDEFLLLGAGVI